MTGLTSNPSIFDKAIAGGGYDDAIHEKASAGMDREELFFELAIEDLRRAADLFGPVHERTDGVDGWVSLEVSPLLAYDTESTVGAARTLHEQAGRDNLFIKIPGTAEGLPAIEEAIFAGVPVNVTLLFSADHYRAAADAYMRGVERRIDAGLNPVVGSVASVFMSRWDAAVIDEVPEDLRDTLALAVGLKMYQAYREVMDSERWQRQKNAGARMQRLLWASTSTKDPKAPDTLYVHASARPSRSTRSPSRRCGRSTSTGTRLPDAGRRRDADETLARMRRRRHRRRRPRREAADRRARRASSTPGTTSCRSSTGRAPRSPRDGVR